MRGVASGEGFGFERYRKSFPGRKDLKSVQREQHAEGKI